MWKNSLIISIVIFWKFIFDFFIRNDIFDGLVVECFYKNGKFIFDMFFFWVNIYVFYCLEVDISYMICINVYERKILGIIIYFMM